MHLALDVTRLRLRGGRTTPSGIDRVEYAYLAYALERSDDFASHFMTFQRMGAGLLTRREARALAASVSQSWRADRRAGDDAAFRALKAQLESPLPEQARSALRLEAPADGKAGKGAFQAPWASPSFVLRTGMRARTRLGTASARLGDAVYLHTSHTQLDGTRLPEWLGGAGVRPVFFLHDVIPIELPEFCRPGEDTRHWTRLKTMAKHGKLILANSRATADDATKLIAEAGWTAPPFAVVPLGVEACFRDPDALDAPRAAHPYAVVVGTIEARKNLSFLFAVWRRLVERHGRAAPRLVVVGRRGWENENVLDYLERSRRLAPYLIEVSDLSDAGLASVMAGARLVVAPSKSEGFSLPVAEALTLGLRVLASDIAAHREVAQGLARLIDPLDGPGWIRAIEEAFGLGGADTAAFPAPSAPYRGLSWNEHVATAVDLIAERLGRPNVA
jgi:glycosyltransferase involved in cell wall biosynthesis